MGIAAAKVPSSSLDKISAEWLEEEIIKTNPAVAARLAPKPPSRKHPSPLPVEEKIVVIHAPAPPPPPAPEPPVEVKPEPVVEAKVEPSARAGRSVEAPPARWFRRRAPKPVVPVVPPPPPKPQVGEKVGFIQLPTRPASSRPGERERGGSSQPRPQPGARPGQPQPGGRPGPAATRRWPPAISTRSRWPSAAKQFGTGQARRAAAAEIKPAGRRAGHHHQAADHRPRAGRCDEAKAVHHHRRADEAARHGDGQPVH